MTIRSKQICIASFLWMVVMTVLVGNTAVSAFIVVPVVLIGIIVVPGVLLALNLNIKAATISETGIYAIVLGLCFTLLGGLGINVALPQERRDANLFRTNCHRLTINF
jgi:uncharacterized membrane protein